MAHLHGFATPLVHRTLTSDGWKLQRSPSAPADIPGWIGPSAGPSIMDDERKYNKRPASRVSAPWTELLTDKPWNDRVANQIDQRCEGLRHVQKTLPRGHTAADRLNASKRRSRSPTRPPKGLAMYAQSEPSLFALANTLPPAHDVRYRKSSMPVTASMLATHYS